MDPNVVVEVCVDSVAGVEAATAGGADRIELCSALELGGLTPSPGLCRAARLATHLPLFAMVRPRPGDFVLEPDDHPWLAQEVDALVAEGVDGLVFGALTPDGDVDADLVEGLRGLASHLEWTFHRAFDHARDPFAALDTLIGLGVEHVLTSGAAPTAVEGADLVRQLVERAAGRIRVMAGSGVRAANVAQLVAATGVRDVHLSAARVVAGPGRFNNPRCSFAAPGRGELERRITDVAEVRAVVEALRRASS